MAAPKYIQRFARLPEVFDLLTGRPGGLPLRQLADAVGTSVDELREDLLTFYATEPRNALFGLQRPDSIDFCAADGSDADPADAEVVRIIGEQPWDELGVEYLDASELALIYTAATALLEIRPDDEELRGAVAVLTQTMLGGLDADAAVATPHDSWHSSLEPLQAAVDGHRRVRITYSAAWSEGVRERVIEPWRLVQTRRGWEVDAGVDGDVRTYLLAHIRSLEVLEETFEPPADVDARIEAQRATTTVRVRVPHRARWAADFHAERVDVVTDDELTATLDLALLPPVEQRIGQLLLVAGEDAQVLAPAGLIAAGPALAEQLLAHHRG
ncbi:helix-turn-helix transcriptional regulator [Nocardioides jiangxiensis]|uniref:WYL domain-containing protein n=1 Tax=Nocardioides jiangxiensis TaxID=3064524 RepID=A0ABT9AYP3_9ACTN|nr:WYL domain-containing protein [Nocardioides sp. WY-20]MDO7867624.1 WYL domain-containing protein [Nocardioides sp. WY-20]